MKILEIRAKMFDSGIVSCNCLETPTDGAICYECLNIIVLDKNCFLLSTCSSKLLANAS